MQPKESWSLRAEGAPHVDHSETKLGSLSQQRHAHAVSSPAATLVCSPSPTAVQHSEHSTLNSWQKCSVFNTFVSTSGYFCKIIKFSLSEDHCFIANSELILHVRDAWRRKNNGMS